jgi:ribonucleoside-diphosphate reductase alpha chain
VEVNQYFEDALADAGISGHEIMESVLAKGSIQDMDFLPTGLRRIFVTAMDIAPIWHLRMQAAFQRHTDNAVSKTVNLPNTATEQDIYDIYWAAYKEGCKGITVYRDGCKSVQVLATGEGQKKMDGEDRSEPRHSSSVRKRPDVVQGFTQKVQTGLGAMYLTVNEVNGEPFEVFATIGKSGRSITAKAEAIGRLVSLALRSGVHVRDVVAQIKGIGGEHPVFRGKGLLLSIPDAIAWVLEKRYLKNENILGEVNDLEKHHCPECNENLVFQEGCLICTACGFSRCG